MQRRQFSASLLAGASTLAFPFIARAQGKAIRIIVPFTAGSGSDEGARFYAEQISKALNQPIIVENKPGASGLIAVRTVLADPADGNTILLGSNSLIAVNPVMVKNLGYDPFKDLVPLHGLGISAAAFVVNSNSSYNSINDLTAKYKATGKPISVGNYSEGYRLVSEWLAQDLGIKIIPVPYKGGAPMVTDLIGGQLDMALNDITGIAPMEKAKKLRVLAITGNERDKMLPNIPTMKELGYPDFESYVWSSLSMKAGTSADRMKELADAISTVQKTDAAKAYQAKRAGTFLAKSLEELGEFQRSEYLRFKRVAERANIHPS
ncbi:ABC transporter substrate-binding protein [Alicycliphilus denitrificans]|uniref:tripartite tricarboxylate transporter substrate binding protein n=1 Tax=Alicycliphilus denitrificans TaxID=179636 RepID=UPI000B081F91|nr:tripartite tricarboxylate transporter substrate binding protein [Alicycliphilus denitrificans]MBN9575325.1 tripartite tricarboxylate transporter substrate binding protein [Alicycliphilus denitrificans]BCN37062.1 ABC transporter substrate-binding protein [Alicycliphilus denitrificans]